MSPAIRSRPAAVAGLFYTSDETNLRASVRAYLDKAVRAEPAGGRVRALIAPHAGFEYSGPIAGSAYATIADRRDEISRVIVIGPAHRVAFSGIAAPTVDCFECPFGDVRIDREHIDRLERDGLVRLYDAPHVHEHSLEVQLPFISEVLGDVGVVPLVVGDADRTEVASVLELTWDDPETVVVVSTDLSHFHPYEPARRRDEATARAIVDRKPDALSHHDACGRLAIQGLLEIAGRRSATVELVDLRSSGDTSGDRARVVGYGAFVVS